MKSKKLIYFSAIVIVIVLLCFSKHAFGRSDNINSIPAKSSGEYERSYQEYLMKNGFDGTLALTEVKVDMLDYQVSEGMEVEEGVNGLVSNDAGSIAWEFEVEEEGFYNLEISYIAIPGTTSDVQRKIKIDGETCYKALDQIVLKRAFADGAIGVKGNNEIRPYAEEVYKTTTCYVEDYNRRSGAPLIFYLEKGTHSVAFEVVKEPIEYVSLIFKAANLAPFYEEAIAKLKNSYEVFDGEVIIAQAERTDETTLYIEKSSTAITIQKNYSDSNLVPYHPYHIMYNTIGGDSFKQPGDKISWDIMVPKEGLYAITFKGRQSLKRGVTSYRRLTINGEIPYQEMNAIGFQYRSDMTNYTVCNEEGEVYYFYFHEGENTIALETVLGSFGGILNEVEESMANLNRMYLSIIKLTGQAPDKYIDYEIEEKIPQFRLVMEEESRRLNGIIDELIVVTGEKGENTSLLEKMAIQADWLSKDPERVVEELTQLKNNISALGTWLVSISSMPLELDSIMISGDKEGLPRATDGTLAGFKNGMVRFLSTFFVSSKRISAETSKQGEETKTIKVWMASAGREQAQIVQNMIDETFTPASGIQVKLQLIPVDVVLRAALAGNGPDVVIGLAQSTMQDFAMRDAVVDLSSLKGYEELTNKYYKSTLDVATFQNGVYGIPEQATFMMLFYRKDILDEIGVTIPTTWQEVKEVIPKIKKHNYDFYLPSTQTAPTYANLYGSIVYQYGGSLYEGVGENYGLTSGLYQEPAMLAFKDYTDLFTSFGLLVTADFSNRFRTGEMPLGITNYTTYCQLEIFAPEIKGLWGFAPLPGIKNNEGEINHSYLVDTMQSVIMSGSNKTDAAWEFVKWWNETNTQLSYATTLESVMGSAARYPAADPLVVARLPWSNSELLQLLMQFESTVGVAPVPGHYMTTRMIQFAFTEVVSNMANPRETLYLNVKEINKELYKKRLEFHMSTSE